MRQAWRQRDVSPIQPVKVPIHATNLAPNSSIAGGMTRIWRQNRRIQDGNWGRDRLNGIHAGGPVIYGSRGSDMTVTTEALATTDLEFARPLGQQLRVDPIRCSTAAGSGHPTSSMSAADLVAVLITRYLQYDWAKPKDPNNDHLIFSKGHASPLYYAMLKAVGAITDAQMMTFRKFAP